MCIIIASPPGTTIGETDLTDAIAENRDGAGWVIRANGTLLSDRSALCPETVVESFLRTQAQHPDSWGVFHARLATHGSVSDVNTHPFMVPGQPWAMVHNGVMGISDPIGERSDSRIFADDTLSRLSWAQILGNRDRLEKWLGRDKVVILSARKERGGPVIFLNENVGTWSKAGTSKGLWFSHPLYRTAGRAKHYTVAGGWDAYDYGRWDKSPVIRDLRKANAHAARTASTTPATAGSVLTRQANIAATLDRVTQERKSLTALASTSKAVTQAERTVTPVRTGHGEQVDPGEMFPAEIQGPFLVDGKGHWEEGDEYVMPDGSRWTWDESDGGGWAAVLVNQ